MTLLRRRVRERFADVLEWIDYRPDAGCWPLLALPPLLSVAWAYGGWIGLGIVVAFAAGVTLLMAAIAALGLLGWIAANAVADVAGSLATARSRTTYSGPKIPVANR